MKGRIFTLLALILLPWLLSGCGNPREIALTSCRVEHLGEVEFEEAGVHTSLHLQVGVSNPTGRSLTLKSFTATVFKEGDRPLAELFAPTELCVPKHFNDSLPVVLDVHLKNPMALILGGVEYSALTADFTAVFRWGGITHILSRTGLPLEALFKDGLLKFD